MNKTFNINTLKAMLEKYSPVNDQEISDKKAMLDFIASSSDVITRDNQFGHFTASAFVVDKNGKYAVMLHHKIMGDWIYPGGHADGEYDLCSVAKREVAEETGLVVDTMFNGEIFAIQSAPVKGHVKRGKYIPAHVHYDVLFVFNAGDVDSTELQIAADENTAVEWWPINEHFVKSCVTEWAHDVIKKIINKLDKYFENPCSEHLRAVYERGVEYNGDHKTFFGKVNAASVATMTNAIGYYQDADGVWCVFITGQNYGANIITKIFASESDALCYIVSLLKK